MWILFYPVSAPTLSSMVGKSALWTDYGRSGSCSAHEGSAAKEENDVDVSEQASRRSDFHACKEAELLVVVESRLGKFASCQQASESAKRSPSHTDDDTCNSRTRCKRFCPEANKTCEHSQIDPNHVNTVIQTQHATPESSKETCSVVWGGGVFTSRISSPTPRMIWTKSNRLRVEDNRVRVFPDFAGCPDWVKPLMYVEYQVRKSHNSFSILDVLGCVPLVQ